MKFDRYKLLVFGTITALLLLTIIGRFFFINGDENLEENNVVVTEDTDIKYKKIYEDCGVEVHRSGSNPPEIFNSLDFTGYEEDELNDFIPAGWNVHKFEKGELVLVYYGEEYSEDSKLTKTEDKKLEYVGYIGVYQDNIAIYKGEPPYGELVEITRYKAKEVYRDELEEGIQFKNEEQKEQILESYTS